MGVESRLHHNQQVATGAIMGHSSDDNDSVSTDNRRSKKRKKSKKRKRHRDNDSADSTSSTSEPRKKRKDRKKMKRKKKRYYSSDSDSGSQDDERGQQKQLVHNERLQQKLLARGETLEERKERRAQKRAAHIASKFGYTADSNPFNDPNLHETFTWKKAPADRTTGTTKTERAFSEIEKVRQRRRERDTEMIERERARADESRVREQEHFQDWATKEEAFHLQQQRQRSAIRLVEGREKPIDVLAKNILMFGLSDQEQTNRARVKYQERYSALDEIKTLEGELEEPAALLKVLKLDELKELRLDVLDFFRLEKEAIDHGQNDDGSRPSTTVMDYWANVRVLVENEIKQLETTGDKSKVSTEEVCSIFVGQSDEELHKMEAEVTAKLQNPSEDIDRSYWMLVLDQLSVHFAKIDLSRMHARMLVRQLEKLEAKKTDLALQKANGSTKPKTVLVSEKDAEGKAPKIPTNVEPGFGDEEAEGTEEVDLVPNRDDARRLRKPRYFNRVRTGYDWNKYNQTHYDQDNPPPKTVQGYKFNIFYPELDPTISPKFSLEAADTSEFCIIRFSAGPPYEDIAFKIVNREWNRSRKKGFKCTFERGILSLYFNFTTFWYRK